MCKIAGNKRVQLNLCGGGGGQIQNVHKKGGEWWQTSNACWKIGEYQRLGKTGPSAERVEQW